jgi:hypothetical protein
MTMLVSLFGVAGRFAGDLLTSALGWASSLLFGRVPRSHQIFVVLMMAWSLVWLVVVVSILMPALAGILLSTTPHPRFIDQAWLGFALTVALIVVPLAVGLAGYLVPSDGERPRGPAALREVLRGYLLTPVISGLLVFLAALGLSRKARSKRHGWSDVHVAIVVKPGQYDGMVAEVRKALDAAGGDLKADGGLTAREAPWVLTVPSRILGRVAGENVRKLRPDRLIELVGRDLRIGLYPSDLAISGTTHKRVQARAAILGGMPMDSLHLTMSAEAQKVEDQLARAAGEATRSAFPSIDARLLELDIPTDEWDILYRLRLKVDRDLRSRAASGPARSHGAAR